MIGTVSRMTRGDHTKKHPGRFPRRVTVPVTERMHRYLQQPHINAASEARMALYDRIGEEELAKYEPDEEEIEDDEAEP